MYNFILQIITMLSLGVMIYLIARAVPRVSEEIPRPESKVDRWFIFLRIEKIDSLFGNFLEKFLRRIKLIIMKLDNITSDHLDKIKKSKINNNGNKSEEKPSLFNSNSKEE